MSESQSVIASLYLPVSNNQLLLPNVSVAEVVAYQEPEKVSDAPDHYLGVVNWRGIRIPVVSYDIANGLEQLETSSHSRIAVINSIGKHHDDLPFFALVTQGIPRLVKVSDDIIKKTRKKKGAADLALIKIDGEEVIIPDLEYLESLAFAQNKN